MQTDEHAQARPCLCLVFPPPSWLRHCLCLVCSTAFVAKTASFALRAHLSFLLVLQDGFSIANGPDDVLYLKANSAEELQQWVGVWSETRFGTAATLLRTPNWCPVFASWTAQSACSRRAGASRRHRPRRRRRRRRRRRASLSLSGRSDPRPPRPWGAAAAAKACAPAARTGGCR